jgi:hypothetical protein
MRLRALIYASALLAAGSPSWAQETATGAAGSKAAPRIELMADYADTIKVDGRDEVRRFKVFFDYTEGVGRRLTYDASGALLREEVLPHGEPRPSDADFAEAVAIVRADRIIGGMVARVKAVPDGGFALVEGEGKACGPRSRCIHVLWLSPDRVGLVRWTVVDLVKQAIAYRAYQAPENPPALEEVSK